MISSPHWEVDPPSTDISKGVSTTEKQGEGIQLSYILYRGRNADVDHALTDHALTTYSIIT